MEIEFFHRKCAQLTSRINREARKHEIDDFATDSEGAATCDSRSYQLQFSLHASVLSVAQIPKFSSFLSMTGQPQVSPHTHSIQSATVSNLK